jgi:glycosyltransferase involved in cell wall biosynthesis
MNKSLYDAQYRLLSPGPQRLGRGESLRLAVELTNQGTVPWLTFGNHPVHLSYHWESKRGRTVIADGVRTALPQPMPPGAQATVELQVNPPLQPGKYKLVIDLVEEGVAWFSQRDVRPLEIPITHLRQAAPQTTLRATIINGNCVINDAVGNHVVWQLRTLQAAGFQTLFLTEYIDERLPMDVLQSSVVLRLPDLQKPNNRLRSVVEHFRTSDVVIVNYSTYYELAQAIKLAPKGRIIFDYHGVTPIEFWDPNAPGFDDLVLGHENISLVQHADFAIAHSQFMRDELLQTGLIAADHVQVVPLSAVDNPGYAGTPDSVLIERYGLRGRRVLLYLGRMARNKRIIDLVEALAIVRRQHPDVVLLLVGDNNFPAYRDYMAEVQKRVEELGCQEHVIWTGQVPDVEPFYQLCDLFVTASVHEGFCVPVIEAMAHGKPVVAAAATALPGTVGDAGLLFEPKNPADLAAKLMRLLEERPQADNRSAQSGNGQAMPVAAKNLHELRDRKIGLVAPRYGVEILGGAERHIRSWAEQLANRGYQVEVLTTCTANMAEWINHYRPGVERINGVTVHRFSTDRVDAGGGYHRVLVKANQGEYVSYYDELDFVHHNLRSSDLDHYLREHADEFKCVIFAPYLFGTTYWGMQQVPEKALILPCLHDEPSARLSVFREMLEGADGLLFNTQAESDFATNVLDVSNPYRTLVGYGFDPDTPAGDGAAFRARHKLSDQILLYSGRLEAGKNVPLLLDYFVRYKEEHPGPLTLVLTGTGDIPIPKRSDIVAVGVLPEAEMPDAYAAALALCQPSLNESFSIVIMESWLQGRPVLVHADCAVTRSHVEQSGGGYAFGNYEQFRDALQRLQAEPARADKLGQQGCAYVMQNYTWDHVMERLLDGIATFTELRSEYECLAQRGIRRALAFTPKRINDQFLHVVGLALPSQRRRQLRSGSWNDRPHYIKRHSRVLLEQAVGRLKREVAVRLGIWSR